MMPKYLIDIPSYFATTEKLEEFLREMETLDQSSPDVQSAIAQVQQMLRDRQGTVLT